MGLSKREKILLVVLVITIVFYLGYNYIYLPNYNKYLTVLDEAENKKLRVLKLNRDLRNKEEIISAINHLKLQAYELDRAIPSYIHQEEVILTLRDIFNYNKINIQSLSFNMNEEEDIPEASSVEEILTNYEKLINGQGNIDLSKYLPQIKKEEDTKNNNNEEDKGEKEVEFFTVNLSYSGEYANLKNALLQMEQRGQKIIVKNISISSSENGIVGNISLAFPYFQDGSIDNFKWNIFDEYGNDNPFTNSFRSVALEEPNNSSNTTEDTENQIPVKSDFYIILKPKTSDMSTSTIGKSPYRHTAIHSDNPNIENIDLIIKEENGSFLYNYNNSIRGFPKERDNFESFTPLGKDIIVTVYSQPRNNPKDTSGIILNVTNETERDVIINIINDDENNPRITINRKAGTVKDFNN